MLRGRHSGRIEPLHKDLAADTFTAESTNPAIELIRRKVAAVYAEEPDIAPATTVLQPTTQQRSPHQQFMYELSTSGRSLAAIQTAWHDYYIHLPDAEKHAVWREFYAANAQQPTAYTKYVTQQTQMPKQQESAESIAPPDLPENPTPTAAVVSDHMPPVTYKKSEKISQPRATKLIKKRILKRVAVSSEAQTKAKQHFQSLLFGLGTGSLVLLIFLFSFFNEMIIAPFIQPSRHVGATPIIIGSDGVAPSETPEIIIPKLNVQIPVVYDEKSIDEAAIQQALERGVIHYPTTVLPGQQGNAAFFGHSSNNIFNKGKYKFAFVLLRQLVPGDIFYLTYDKKVYSYRVFDKKIVPPNEVSVLGPVEGKPATAALITCDPPGTSTNRLVVWGEQISPDPAGATKPAETAPQSSDTPTELPSEGPTLWSRFWNSIF